jgi:hypothetical protein
VASLYKIGGSFKVQFLFGGARRTLAVGEYRPAAETMQDRIEKLIDLAHAN